MYEGRAEVLSEESEESNDEREESNDDGEGNAEYDKDSE